jgi:YidC/Oxa1 family membrane protein insertase
MLDKLSTEVRMLIAFLLVMLVFGVQQFLAPPPGPQPTKQAPKNDQKQVAEPTTPPPAPATTGPAQIQAEQFETFAIDTGLHKVVFSNRGATIRNWVLTGFKDNNGKPLELVNQKSLQVTAIPAPFSLSFPAAPSVDPNDKLYKVTRSSDDLTVTFEYANGPFSAKKTFQFKKDSYLVKLTSEVIQNGQPLPHSVQWRGGFGDVTGVNPTAEDRTLYYDTPNTTLEKKDISDVEDGPVTVAGNYAFAGIEDKYFAAVAIAGTGNSTEIKTFSDAIPAASADGKPEPHLGASIGGSGTLKYDLYVGPKDATLLRTVDKRLEQLIDWGWFFFIAQPLFLLLHWLVDHFTHNWGWAIIALTVIINIALFPLRLSSMKSSKKMQAIQPHIKKINDKYAGIAMNDPRKAEQNQELMDLYKAHGINPVGGCFPMLLQIPFFYALYKVLSITIELRGAPWLWVADLSQPESIAIRILPILLVVTQFLSQKMTPSPGMDPAQQKIMLFMPLMFGFMFWGASAGLVLYWLTSNVVSIAQQLLLNRNTPAPAVAVVVPPKKKK